MRLADVQRDEAVVVASPAAVVDDDYVRIAIVDFEGEEAVVLAAVQVEMMMADVH